MTTHRAPVRGDKFTAVTSCCGVRLADLPPGDGLVVDADTPSCGLPAITAEEPVERAA